MRDLHPDFSDQIAKKELAVAQLIACEFSPDPVYAWSGTGTLVYGGRNYLGFSGAVSAQTVSETAEVEASSIELSVPIKKTAEDLGFLRSVRARGKEVIITEVILNADTLEVLGADVSFRGVAGEMTLRVGPRAYELSVTVANELEGLKKTWGLTHSDSDQKLLFPGDTSHRFIPFFQDLDFRI